MPAITSKLEQVGRKDAVVTILTTTTVLPLPSITDKMCTPSPEERRRTDTTDGTKRHRQEPPKLLTVVLFAIPVPELPAPPLPHRKNERDMQLLAWSRSGHMQVVSQFLPCLASIFRLPPLPSLSSARVIEARAVGGARSSTYIGALLKILRRKVWSSPPLPEPGTAGKRQAGCSLHPYLDQRSFRGVYGASGGKCPSW